MTIKSRRFRTSDADLDTSGKSVTGVSRCSALGLLQLNLRGRLSLPPAAALIVPAAPRSRITVICSQEDCSMSQVMKLQRQQLQQAARALADALNCDPVTTYLFPNERSRLAAMESVFAFYLHIALGIGEVLTTSDVKGAAIWIRPGQNVSIARALRSSLILIPLRFGLYSMLRMIRYSLFISKLHTGHPMPEAWYLFSLGVKRAHQGAGIGSMLVQPMLESADKSRTKCYLETSSERNLAIYVRHDFRVVDHVTMTESGLPVWLMRRDPKR